jgi:hypothetical protein
VELIPVIPISAGADPEHHDDRTRNRKLSAEGDAILGGLLLGAIEEAGGDDHRSIGPSSRIGKVHVRPSA